MRIQHTHLSIGTLKYNCSTIYSLNVFDTHAFIVLLFVSSATADAVLTTELACLRCAKNYLANFSWDQSYEKTFIAATHHKDEQVTSAELVTFLAVNKWFQQRVLTYMVMMIVMRTLGALAVYLLNPWINLCVFDPIDTAISSGFAV